MHSCLKFIQPLFRDIMPSIVTLTLYQPVGFEVLTAMSTKMAVFWVVAPCSLVVYQYISQLSVIINVIFRDT
jgi:hypothetical protein